MYNDFFGFKNTPFTIAPDPRFLFMSERHRDALAHLLYGIGSGGGFVMLTGEVGTGKTTVCRCLLEQLSDNVRLAYILNPKLNAIELMATMCDELGIEYRPGENSLKAFTDLLRDYLLSNHAQGLNTVLMIDEAQNLSVEVMEQIRLLTNLETNEKKLLQIILIGQPELQELLAKKELRQLAQRVTARYHLKPLNLNETSSYIEHRLRVAGLQRSLFKPAAIKEIHKASGGVPRLINVISDRALLGASVEKMSMVTVPVVRRAIKEVLGEEEPEKLPKGKGRYLWYAVAGVLLLAIGYYLIAPYYYLFQDKVSSQNKQSITQNQAQISQDSSHENNTEQVDKNAQSISENGTSNYRSNGEVAQEFWGEQSWDRTGVTSARNLFALWGVTYYPYQSSRPCEYAANYNLSCDSGMADWNYIKQLNRPINLKFGTETSGIFWGTLKSIEGDNFVLQFGNNEVRMKQAELNPLWLGEYQLFWKIPDGFVEQTMVGDSGPVVRWLTDAIYTIDNINITPADRFSAEVKNWLLGFQQAHGLVADGILGKHSVIMINNQVVDNIPKLIDSETGGSQPGGR
ncbi:ExeA family protein [Kangiella sediminilitoris]|uniref:AAA ATPase n=1 Tax=Kangiella sediminilitoris TaxID=1144748 RepID=A0A1B3B8N4_9GAMM|nr:AAA family ATPase [Kangiella sediminilitoris]AOE49157.1 AAA ATPase [Kangiella sediminilitoris]